MLHPLADVGFQDAEGLLVPLDGHRQGTRQPLRGVVIQDDPLRDFDSAPGRAERLHIAPKVP